MNDRKREGPFSLDMDFDEAVRRLAQTDPKEITPNASSIKSLASKSGSKEITPQGELDLGIEIERDIGGIGMGVLGDGTPYLNQRGLAVLCGVQNAHIGTISSQWNEAPPPPKPRITAISAPLDGSACARRDRAKAKAGPC